jgi:two-component system sensor histidine kinase/response regulator
MDSRLKNVKRESVHETVKRKPALRGDTVMPNLIIDLPELLARVENDRELICELLQIFKDEFPRRLQVLHQAVDSLDGEKVAAEAHSLKGMLSNLAAGPAASAAARLEQLGRNRAVSEFPEAFDALESISKELLLQLDTNMTEVLK